MIKRIGPVSLSGKVQIPPSKSDGQRAILAAGLAKGKSRIRNIGESDDEQQMLENIRILGARVSKLANDAVEIEGGFSHLDQCTINSGESGLGLRLIAPVSAIFSPNVRILGNGTLLTRPQFLLEDQLQQLGVRVRSNNGFLPFELEGNLNGGKLNVDGSVSSQFLSGLLMALPLVKDDSLILVSNLKSVPYVKMTMNTLEAFGIHIQHREFEVFEIKGSQEYVPNDYVVEGDWSSASYWLVASAISHDVHVCGLSTRSFQADKAIIGAFQAAGCEVIYSDTDIRIDGSKRCAFSFDCSHSPDLFPALVALAAHCEGISEITGLGRLQHKESNRGLTLRSEFAKLGVRIELDDDVMRIHGGTITSLDTPLSSHHDHRIAMALAIAQSKGSKELTLENAEAVSKSYPSFWDHFESLKM